MKNNGFTIIGNNILKDDNLNIYEKYFLIALKSFDHKGMGEVYPTYETLMKLCGTTKRNTIAKIVKSLKEKNYIVVMKKNRANCYKFIKDYLTVSKNNSSNDTNVDTKDNPTIVEDTDINNQNNIDNEVNNSNLEDTTTSNQRDTTSSNLRDTHIKENDNNSNLKDTTTSNPKDTSNSIQRDTLKIKEKNTKEIYINIFNAWNDTDIYNEDKLTMKIVNSITIALRRHTLEEILTAIKNYKEVYYSDYYYDYTWSLPNFLVKPNALRKFTEDGEIWTNYKSSNKNPNKEKFNLAELID